jgi:hypothetical protein
VTDAERIASRPQNVMAVERFLSVFRAFLRNQATPRFRTEPVKVYSYCLRYFRSQWERSLEELWQKCGDLLGVESYLSHMGQFSPRLV